MPCEWLVAPRVIESAGSIVGPAGTDTILGNRSEPNCMTPRQFRSFMKKNQVYLPKMGRYTGNAQRDEMRGKRAKFQKRSKTQEVKNRKNAGMLAGQTTAYTFSMSLVMWCSMYNAHLSFDFQIKVRENVSHVRILYCLGDRPVSCGLQDITMTFSWRDLLGESPETPFK